MLRQRWLLQKFSHILFFSRYDQYGQSKMDDKTNTDDFDTWNFHLISNSKGEMLYIDS